MVAHPAKFSSQILEVIDTMLPQEAKVLDPFAGTGLIHTLGRDSIGIEIEPEWAEMHPRTIVGNALFLPFPDSSWPWVVTSPTYSNRMADNHNAKDGSTRITYKHKLGRDLHPDNSGSLQWGDKYLEFHRRAWAEVARVLIYEPNKTGFILNIKNHWRNKQVARVAEGHIAMLGTLGFVIQQIEVVPVTGMKFGANSEARVPYEYVIRFSPPKK